MNNRGGVKKSIVLACALGTAGSLATIGETWCLGQIVGVLERQGSEIWDYLLIVLGMVVLEYLSNTAGLWVEQMTRRRIMLELRRRLFEKTVNIEYLQLKARDSGDLNSLYLSDVETIGRYYRMFMSSFGQIAGGVAALLICTLISWKFLLINLCIFPVILLLGEFAGRNMKKYAYGVQQKKGSAAAVLLDTLRNERMAKSYWAQEHMLARFEEAAGEENGAVMKEAGKRAVVGGVNRITGSLPYLAIFIVGGILIFGGEIRLGEFFAFSYIFSNVQSLQNIFELRVAKKGCRAAQSRLEEFFLQPDETAGESQEAEYGEKSGEKDAEGLYFCDVSFAYGNGPDVFHGTSLHIAPGTSVGIVGESGSGKSTFLGLLMGLYAPKAGAVRYYSNGICYEGSACREKMAVVFQDNYVFPTTIRKNLLMGKPDASREELLLACREAGIWEDIEKMPDGLDTGVGEMGHSLSGGQRQRICIARALLGKPEILVMDEPSASLDTVHEMQLMEEMTERMKDGILIVVSHRQSTIGSLKEIYSMENGALRRMPAPACGEGRI